MKICRRNLRLVLAVLAVLASASFMHAQDNLRDAAPFNGYTGEVFDTTHYAYDYLVDGNLPQDDPAHKQFKTLQAAYAAATAGTPDKPTIIGIKPNVYAISGTATEAGITITKNYITLLGLTDDRRKVVLADNRGNKEGASNNGYLMIVNATGFTMMNLTVVNYCNLDYEYPGDPSKNLKKRSDVITQAVAMQSDGDKHVYSHVAFLGRLDTLFIRTTRSYFTNVFVEGTDDFIGGGTVGVWENSEVYFPTGDGVMSSSGIAFINTVFKAKRGVQFYKGFRNPVALIDCTLPAPAEHGHTGWLVWKAPLHQNLYSLTYHSKFDNGKPLVLPDSIVGPPAYDLSREISDSEAAAFNPWNMLRAVPNGAVDDWDPAGVREKYAKHGDDVFRMTFAGPTGLNGAAAGAGLLGPFTAAAAAPPSIRTGSTTATLTTTVMPVRAQGQTITWSTKSPLVTLSSTTGKSITVSGNNSGTHGEFVSINATAPDGYFITARVFVEPKYTDPPAFTKRPALVAPANGVVRVNYALDLGGRDDQSLITWYLCDDAQCSTHRAVAVSRGNEPLKTYTLTTGAIGKYVEVGIQPKHNVSDPGAEVTVIAAKPVAAKDVASSDVSPDFRNFVETTNENYVNGMWSVLGTWMSVSGEGYVNGYGVRAATEGAALFYQGAPTGDMQVKIVMTPEKTAGQGFGIAGSPDDSRGPKGRNERADIYIKYDPQTKTGYSLRFWRTIQAADKCMFQLYKIVNGIGTPVSDQQQLTGVFKPNVTFTLSIIGSTFTATGSNTTDDQTLSLKGTIDPNQSGGAGFVWTGSTPVGNSLAISRFDISYPNSRTRKQKP